MSWGKSGGLPTLLHILKVPRMYSHWCKVELNRHISNDNKRQEQIVLKNPIINKIFMQPSAAAKCRKDWPKIKFTVLDKKSFDSISVWEN